jgi:hypothetical protein
LYLFQVDYSVSQHTSGNRQDAKNDKVVHESRTIFAVTPDALGVLPVQKEFVYLT